MSLLSFLIHCRIEFGNIEHDPGRTFSVTRKSGLSLFSLDCPSNKCRSCCQLNKAPSVVFHKWIKFNYPNFH